jgi:hypothetical protein
MPHVIWRSHHIMKTLSPLNIALLAASLALCAFRGVGTAQAQSPGALLPWGNSDYGQTTVPLAVPSGVTAMAAESSYTVALKNDGNVVAWEEKSAGQTNVSVLFTFTFSRDYDSETPDATLTVESGADLVIWPGVFTIRADTAACSPGTRITEIGVAPDVITVAIPIGANKTRFARMKVRITP